LLQAKVPAPPAPAAPVVAGTPARAAATPTAIYEGFRAQRRELSNQLDELDGTRREIQSQLEQLDQGDVGRKPLEDRLTDIDSRIKAVDAMLAANATQLAQAAAIPGAVAEQRPPEPRQGPPEEAWVLGGIFLIVAVFPLSVAFARRIWRRSAAAVTSLPRDIADRLQRMEQAIEATAVEVERIGEGQRFITRLFSESQNARAIATKSAERNP
jgi:prefoldin subunit 5